ncbi:BTAD domain-containing putative transcriptional regulator [Pseudonocardia sp. TRM90224]|uniref:BTAD domain-containing putative transcriptional regulator n=1 Tax=Pseudonocardia sp. TRM90224 TaxID=2812678 RepID=UPI001E55D53D|nr:BTAD domain-containing putative transcriptional regulator [Pseudonocardia sp. TRM90224]
MGVHLQLLGRFQVRRDGAEIPPAAFGGRKVRAMLRVLAVRRPDLVAHDVLAEALWPDRLPADPATNLGVLVNRARRALGDPSLVVTGTRGYALGDCATDLAELLAALDAARSAGDDHAAAATACRAGLAIWGEPLPEDIYSAWAGAPRERLRRARLELCVRAAKAALGLGDPRTAVAYACDAVDDEPTDESAVIVLAESLTAAGDPAGALTRLHELRARLADELGIDPSPEVERLQIELLRGEAGPRAAGGGQRRVGVPAPTRPRAFGPLAFVRRDAQLARLREAVAAGGLAVVAGAPGSGKSRLLAELAGAADRPVVAARAFLPERAEAWSLARSLLREALAVDAALADGLPPRSRDALAVLLPELGGGPAQGGETFRALVLAGGVRLLDGAAGNGAVGDGALLVVDDLQWADASSIALVCSALARLPNLSAVLAHRPAELPEGALDGLEPDVEITLGALPLDGVAALTGNPATAAAIIDATDGTPFAVAEVLRELAARGVAVAGPGSGAYLPLVADLGRAGQRRTALRRARRETGLRAQMLELLALVAREISAGTLAVAAGCAADVALQALAGLAASGLARLGEQGWATAHDLLTEVVTEGMDAAGRARIHGMLARALAAEDADPSEIARHHRGAGDPGAAALAYATAAARALTTHATTEAVALASAGLDLQPAVPVRAELLEIRAQARAAHGEADAAADLTAALRITDPGADRARRLSRLAMLTFGARDTRQAAELAELALVEAGGDEQATAFALETAAVIDMNVDRAERAGERAEAALSAYRRLGDAAGVARILDGRAMAVFLEGRITEGIAEFGRVARLFDASGELLRVVTPRSTMGHGLVFAGRPAEGLDETTAALRLACDLDATEGQAYALWHRSEALAALGRVDEAEADAREALALASAAGHRGWTATAHRALGIALAGRGDLDGAAAAFDDSARLAGESLGLFGSWAAARSALVRLAAGRTGGVEPLVRRALATGPPLGHHEARLAEVELLVARGDPAAARVAADAVAHARAAGYVAGTDRLAVIADF